MNDLHDFSVKKLAEVQAFADVCSDITGRSGKSFEEAQPGITALLRQAGGTDVLVGSGLNASQTGGSSQQDLFETKRRKTTAKLTAMMELYVGDDWDNPIEVMEWLSFFAGAAAAHSALCQNTACGLGEKQLSTLSAAEQTFRQLLDADITALRNATAILKK